MRKRLVLVAVTLVAALSLFAFGAHKTFADGRDFQLRNASRVTFVHVYVSPVYSDDWEEDVLGQDVLVPGDYVNIHFNRFVDSGECMFDIRVEGMDGSHGTLWGVNLCTTDTVTFR